MGYDTFFKGAFFFNKEVAPELVKYINLFSQTRRMKRDNKKIMDVCHNWRMYSFNGELGQEGEYFVGGTGVYGQDADDSVVNYNTPPITQPSLWCHWIIKGNKLVWNGAEKFYNYIEWLQYLIDNFFIPSGYILNGQVEWQGEDEDDFGIISVEDNEVTI